MRSNWPICPTETALHQAVGANRCSTVYRSGSEYQYCHCGFRPGRRFATVEADGEIKIWGVEGGGRKVQRQPLRIIPGSGRVLNHIGPGYAMAFSPDGRSLAAADSWDTVKIWDSAGERTLRTWRSICLFIDRLQPGWEPAPPDSGVTLWDRDVGSCKVSSFERSLQSFRDRLYTDRNRLAILARRTHRHRFDLGAPPGALSGMYPVLLSHNIEYIPWAFPSAQWKHTPGARTEGLRLTPPQPRPRN
jgi:WD40 repeat protein